MKSLATAKTVLNLCPMPANDQSYNLEGLRDEYGWAPVTEARHLIGLNKNGAMFRFVGGQLELSGAPLSTIHETCDEVNTHLERSNL